jgi:hypothetical protein
MELATQENKMVLCQSCITDRRHKMALRKRKCEFSQTVLYSEFQHMYTAFITQFLKISIPEGQKDMPHESNQR